MTDPELIELVVRMRAAQKAYFKERREGNSGIAQLRLSQSLERQVDLELHERASPQGSLI